VVSETILVAEDERAVRSMLAEMLADEGFTVLEAEDGVAALEVARRHTGPIHLLLTDATMPRMGGRELAERLVAQRPDTRVVIVSGYTVEALLSAGAIDRSWTVLAKPFAPGVLVDTVRAALGR
jgi:two-component system, cell cycle sensor histidine kinase and response regulator CckA